MKPIFMTATALVLFSIGTIAPTYADICYGGGCDESKSSTANNTQQILPTDKGSLMVRFYTDPQNPAILSQTTLQLSFENKDTNYPLSDIDYKVLISKGSDLIYETPVSHSTQGTAGVQYQFKEQGQYQVAVYVTGMNSQKIPQETVSFPLTVGSAVPEFPTSVVIVLAVAVISIVVASARTRLRISN